MNGAYIRVANLGSLAGWLTLCACGGASSTPSNIESIGDTEPFPTEFGASIEGGGEGSSYQVFDLTIGGDNYKVQTNPWGGGTQTVRSGGGSVFEVLSLIPPENVDDWQVAAFPSVYKGKRQGDQPSQNSGMPIAIGNINSIRTGLSTNTTSVEFKGNTTYDVYFTHDEASAASPPDNFLMVWFDATDFNPINTDNEGYGCGGRAPTYINACTDQGIIEVSGKKFVRFFGSNGFSDVVSYVPMSKMDKWEFDLKYFIDDAVKYGYLDPDMYLQSIQAGFEIVNGGEGLTVKEFYADVQ